MVAAAALALKTLDSTDPIILVGDEAQLGPLLTEAGLGDHPKISIHHASEVIEMHDKPLQALKRKRDSSMVRAIELVKSGEAKVVVSCGNTGSLMAGGTLRLRTLEGIERPALAMVIPNKTEHFILIDVGANPSAKPEHLVHNAILGSHYAHVSLGIARPRVGLLSIGTEEGKGKYTEVLQQAAARWDTTIEHEKLDREILARCGSRYHPSHADPIPPRAPGLQF